jgi:hypothetical protein
MVATAIIAKAPHLLDRDLDDEKSRLYAMRR